MTQPKNNAKAEAMEQTALEILNYTRRRLAGELPALLPAIYLLPDVADGEPGPLRTDGKKLYYHPRTVVETYAQSKTALAAELLHILAHGLLGHISKRQGQNETLFDAAADLKAALLVRAFTEHYVPDGQRRELRKLERTMGQETLESLYLLPESAEEARALVRKAAPFRLDTHALWGKRGGEGEPAADGADAEVSALWQMAAQQVAEGCTGQGQGDLAGMICETYRCVEASGISYAEFLRRFAEKQECVQVDPDSIDPIWYHTGLSMLGNTAIIEPNELREDAPVLDLAVALDTSGSCSGEIMTGFLEELMSILQDPGSVRFRIHLIQCDAEIRYIQELTREDDPQQLLEGFRVHGCGGTDFRPVFRWLAQREDAAPIRGLLYLSDGYGTFPKEPPDYPVAFLFPKDQHFGKNHIPAWVTQVWIEGDHLIVRDGADR